MNFEAIVDFFLNRMDSEMIFEFVERSEYLVLYNIKKCMDASGEDKAYMSDIADRMNVSIINTSKAINALADKGYVSWKTDESKERTYVTFTSKAKELMEKQNQRMENAYMKISEEIPKEEIIQTLSTLDKVRSIIKEVNK